MTTNTQAFFGISLAGLILDVCLERTGESSAYFPSSRNKKTIYAVIMQMKLSSCREKKLQHFRRDSRKLVNLLIMKTLSDDNTLSSRSYETF